MSALVDPFGRRVCYLRVSVTDRCDLRCTYCMSEIMKFLPKRDVLALDELSAITHRFIDMGVRKVRISGGEPLVRKDIMELMKDVSGRLAKSGGQGDLKELTLTTNATQLARYADGLAAMGVRRINVSLDTLDRELFAKLCRRDRLPDVLEGLEVAREAGLAVKVNTVLLPDNIAEIADMTAWLHGRGFDHSLIEIMPMGETGEDRRAQFVPATAARDALEARFTLSPLVPSDPHAGPARFWRVEETGGRVGFISPLTNNFCASCNRVRLTCTGRVYQCLGRDEYVDLRAVLREGGDLDAAILAALGRKPERHNFTIAERASVARHMSVTGG